MSTLTLILYAIRDEAAIISEAGFLLHSILVKWTTGLLRTTSCSEDWDRRVCNVHVHVLMLYAVFAQSLFASIMTEC